MADIRKDGHDNVSVFSYAGSITLLSFNSLTRFCLEFFYIYYIHLSLIYQTKYLNF